MHTDAEAVTTLPRSPRALVHAVEVLSLLAPLLLVAVRFDLLSAGRVLHSVGRERMWLLIAVFAGISLLEALFFMSTATSRRERLTFLLLPGVYGGTLALLFVAPQDWLVMLSALLVIAVAAGLVALRRVDNGSPETSHGPS